MNSAAAATSNEAVSVKAISAHKITTNNADSILVWTPAVILQEATANENAPTSTNTNVSTGNVKHSAMESSPIYSIAATPSSISVCNDSNVSQANTLQNEIFTSSAYLAKLVPADLNNSGFANYDNFTFTSRSSTRPTDASNSLSSNKFLLDWSSKLFLL